MAPTRGTAAWIGILLAAAGTAGCGERRPDTATWRGRWNDARAGVPGADAFDADPRSACNALLVGARRARAALLPSPDPALDAPVRSWIDRAEALGYECPAAEGRAAEQRAGLEELRLLEAEIGGGLEAGATP